MTMSRKPVAGGSEAAALARGRRLTLLLCASALASPLAVAPALAQDAATIDENAIIVTAQRRAEALEDVPMSVTALSSEALAKNGVTSLRDIQNVTTGIQLGQGGAYPQPAIRGVTTVINGTYENNVAVYVDGLYQTQAQVINIDLPNVEGIQVLKGPQGTLYGRNATGGAILLNTVNPGPVWQGRGEVTYARFDDKRASAYVAGPVTDRVGISLSGYIRRSDGYNKLASRTVPGETDGHAAPLEQDSIRAKVKVDLSETLSATMGFAFTRVSDARGNLFTPYENRAPYGPAQPTVPTRLGVAAWDIDTEVATKQIEGSLILDWDLGFGALKSITGYGKTHAVTSYDFDGSYLNGAWSSSTIQNKTFQQALDFSVTSIDNLDLIVGASYFNDKIDFLRPSVQYAGAGNNAGTTEQPLSSYTLFFSSFFAQKKEAWAAYADATFRLSDAITITAGGRYSSETQDPSGYQTSISPAFVRAPNSRHAKFSQFTPRASIRYEVAPRTNVYASYSKGFRSGAFNTTLPVLADDWRPAKQETIDAYEIGIKSAGGRLRFELAGFYYDYKNLQVSTTLVSSIGSPIVDVTNAPKAKIKGVEGSFEWEPLDNLTVRAGASYMHARYGDGFTFNGVGVNPALSGTNVNADPLRVYRNVTQVQDLSGLQMSRAPDFSANFGVDYLIPMGEGGLRIAYNVKYTDSYVVTNPSIWCQPTVANGQCAGVPEDRQRQQRFREGNFALFNASLTYTDPSDHYYVRVWGTNLTDHRYRLHYSGTSTWGTYSPMAEPRTYGVTAGYKF